MASSNPTLAHNLRRIAHLDIPGGGQVVVHDGHVFVGHMKPPHGTSIIDVRDPANPRLVGAIELPDPYSHTHKVRVVGDLMYTNVEQNNRHFLRKGARLPALREAYTREHGGPLYRAFLDALPVAPDEPLVVDSSLVWLGAAFAVLVVLAARWRGLRALAGLAASLAISVFFIVPAILEGTTPILVALVGSLAILLVTLPVAHGIGPTAVAAALATAAALIATLALAELATGLAHITGFGSEEASYIRAAGQDVSVRGMLIAGIVIAALGVLDDLTISQASTVMALHRVSPGHPPRALFVEAMRVGRDHIVAVINTLVLAYVGASLPVLLVFSIADVSFGDAVNSEVVAAEVVATLVGSIGLMAAAPLATGIAPWLAPSVPPGTSEPHHHAH